MLRLQFPDSLGPEDSSVYIEFVPYKNIRYFENAQRFLKWIFHCAPGGLLVETFKIIFGSRWTWAYDLFVEAKHRDWKYPDGYSDNS